MLSEVNACFRLSALGYLSEEDVSIITHDTEEVKLTTYDGRVFLFKKNDIEIVKHSFEDSNGIVSTYTDRLLTMFHQCNTLDPEKIDAVKIKGIPHRVFRDEGLLVLYNERKREVVLKCSSEEFVSVVKALDANCKVYKQVDGFL